MPSKDKNTDDFWDISDMVPVTKRTVHRALPQAVAAELKTGAALIGGGESIPKRTYEEKTGSARQTLEYSDAGRLVRRVRLIPWKSSYSFYSKFVRDAKRLYGEERKACPHVSYFSYMPQYEQLSESQRDYYIYWRSCVRGGNYPDTDSSYIFLYLYELINLSDVCKPEEGAELFGKVWAGYRDRFPYLDKYVGEWLCDYCLIRRTPPPECIYPFIADTYSKLSLPEFYMDYCDGALGFDIIRVFSLYDYKKSSFYTDNKSEFDSHIPKAASEAVRKYIDVKKKSGTQEVYHSLRDSFQGAVAALQMKYKIETESSSLRRSREFRQICSLCVKQSENELRACLGIKSRFNASALPEDIKKVISDYFDAEFPERHTKKKKSASGEAEESYMALYEPENTGEADITRAMEMENEAWSTAVILGEAEECTDETVNREKNVEFKETIMPGNDMYIPDGGFEAMLSSLSPELITALTHALTNDFCDYCKKTGVLPDETARIINELSSELTGDIIMDSDFGVIEDYKEDIATALRAYTEI